MVAFVPIREETESIPPLRTLNIFVSDLLLDAMDNKRLTALFLLDLSKAFDSISHSILLQKLSHIDASQKVVDWFRSYLSSRSKAVRIGSSTSKPLPITHGVPQGGILSPLLFCVYITDVPCAKIMQPEILR